MAKKRILVTGATGYVGQQVLAQLAGKDCVVRALSRFPDECGWPEGVEAVRGDFTDPSSLDACLRDVDSIFLIWTAPIRYAHEVVKRIARHVRHIVFLTHPHRAAHPFFQQRNPLMYLHAALERLVNATGVPRTFLRPGTFAINALPWWEPLIRWTTFEREGTVRWPYGDAQTAPIHERDIAEVAVRALLDAEHEGGDYVLTGPESLTLSEQIVAIGEAIDRSLRLEEISAQVAREELRWVMPSFLVDAMLAAWAASIGQPALVTSTVEEITGHPARRFRDWARDHSRHFWEPVRQYSGKQRIEFQDGPGVRVPLPKPGYALWVEWGKWYTARKINPVKFGAHRYADHCGGRCSCGCSMGSSSSSGPVDPFGACPDHPLSYDPKAEGQFLGEDSLARLLRRRRLGFGG